MVYKCYKANDNEYELPIRLDQFLATLEPEISRNQLQKEIANGNIKINGKTTSGKNKKTLIFNGDEISYNSNEFKNSNHKASNIIYQVKMNLDIIYEDEDVIIINKPKGMVVHPGAGTTEPTMAEGLLERYGDSLSDLSGKNRPGIVHRIDKDTSGLLMVAKNNFTHEGLKKQLMVHSIKREYVALVHGNFKETRGYIDKPLDRHPTNRTKKTIASDGKGRNAYTEYQIEREFRNFTLVKCILKTGRTHQIRVHMSSIGHPIVGDKLYGPRKTPWKLDGQMLHAKTIGFVHPRTRKYLEFSAPIPDEFRSRIEKLPPK
ncbi:RluA family pseudouridine synthase [Eubacteriales bacterium KG127]